VAKLSATNQGLLLAFSAVLLGVLLSALQTPLIGLLRAITCRSAGVTAGSTISASKSMPSRRS